MEKGNINFVFLIVLSVFLLGFISSASCSVTTSCPNDNRVMRLSSTTNAHGAIWDQGSYANYLCCDFTGTHTCDGENKVLGLSSTTNAHAEIPSLSTYPEFVCFGNLSCFSTTSSSCPPGNFSMLSLSANTNAHLGQFSDYPIKICCKFPIDEYTCGDGIVAPPMEECDDGVLPPVSGDGCSATCGIEDGWACLPGNPSVCYETGVDTYWVHWPSNIESYVREGGDSFDIAHWNYLVMWVDDNLGLPYGTPVTFTIYNSDDEVLGTSIGSVYNTNIGSGWFAINQNFLDSLNTNGEDIYFKMTQGGRTITGDTVRVTPRMCDLISASWSITTPTDADAILEGTPVKMNLQMTNCNSKDIVFQIREKDGFANSDDIVATFSRNYNGGATWNVWVTVFTDDTDGGQTNPPEYYFRASVDTDSPIESPHDDGFNDIRLLRVNPTCNNNGTCDSSLLESCVTCPADCGCSEGEYCDNLDATCKMSCDITSLTWSHDRVLNGTLVSLNIEGTGCNNKLISFAIWEKDGSGNPDDPITSQGGINPNPITFPTTGRTASVNWNAFWMDDTDGFQKNPPEYYFKASVTENTVKTFENQNNLLEVAWCGSGDIESPIEECDGANLDGETCLSLGYVGGGELSCDSTCMFDTDECLDPEMCLEGNIKSCEDYKSENDCENDENLCKVGGDIIDSCGETYTNTNGCEVTTDCGCSWEEEEGIGTCKDSWEMVEVCEVCDSDDECWKMDSGGLCEVDCGCREGYVGNVDGYCEPIHICDSSDECWRANAHCTDECVCETGHESNGDGTCGNSPDACVENIGINDCWLMGDACNSDCECETGFFTNNIGYCEPIYCDSGDECWIQGDKCTNDCECETGEESNFDGTCGTQENILEIGKCSYTEGGTDDCSDGHLVRDLTALWNWNENNNYPTKINEDYILDVSVISPPTYRYDPLDPYGPELDSRISDKCSDVNDVLVCPAAVEVSFFNIVNFVVAVALLILIYYIIYSLKKKNKKTAKKTPVKKKNSSKGKRKKR